MTRSHAVHPRLASERGFSMLEMLISTTIMVVVTGAIFGMLDPATGAFNTQPEVSDLQQRLRVGVDSIQKDLVMAGAGTYMGESTGALHNFLAPIMPYRAGDISPDPPGTFRTDAISVMFVPPTPAQTRVNKAMGQGNSQELDVEAQLNCADDKKDRLCGFKPGMRVMILEPEGNYDSMTITHVQAAALHLQHNASKLSSPYDDGSAVLTQIAAHTYYLKSDVATKTFQLMHYDGYNTDLPVADNVVKLEFEYWGEPNPPQLIPNKTLTDPKGPWTTYGPKPPPLGIDKKNDTWAAGENCTFAVVDGGHVPRLATLGAGGLAQVRLTKEQLTDGPWCADGTKPNRYDADLLRIRRIRVSLRVQVAAEWLRGPSAVLFKYPGGATGSKYVPDQEVRFDVAPRNMNLGR
jgi:hypothetical protein